jgi:hypothetical protein
MQLKEGRLTDSVCTIHHGKQVPLTRDEIAKITLSEVFTIKNRNICYTDRISLIDFLKQQK